MQPPAHQGNKIGLVSLTKLQKKYTFMQGGSYIEIEIQ